ncbi:MAG TPA: outer membrane beta-barrel family protein, partial [Puia sp.]|nr:outer membrane beta-barrel family protein [Puia sp.]
LIGQVRNADRSSNQEITVQVDDETPLDSNQLIGFGAKYIIRRVISDYSYATAAESEPFTGERSPGLTNRFTYDQVVTAAYLEYTLNTRTPLSLRTGLRYEYTAIHAGLATAGSALPGISPYGALVPAVNLGWRLGNGNMVRLGITRRIQRPSIQYLNPNEFAPAPGSLSMGNPALGPEFADNIELGYTTAIGSLTIGMSAFYRHTTGAIESVSFPSASGDTIERTYANIGTERSGGLDVYSNLDQGRKLSLSGGADIYYAKLDGGSGPGAGGSSGPGAGGFSASGAGGRNSGWVVTGRLSGGYRFVKGWSLYLYSYYRGSRVLLQGFQSGYPYYSLTLKRDLAKGRGTIGLGAENFLSKAIRVTTKINSGALTESTTNLSHTLSLRVYMSLVLGRLRVVRKERQKKSVTNDDLKAG